MPVPTIDTHEFTRRGDTASGRVPVAELERLGTLLVSTDGELDWRLSGRSEVGTDGSRRAFLHLEVEGPLRMRCVRCLEPVDIDLGLENDYRLVATEAQAEQEDADEDAFDVLVAARRFDLGALVEDEAIMALPPAPRHDDCSAPAPASGPPDADPAAPADAPPKRNPFAALAALRGEAGGGEGARAPGDDVPDDPPTPALGAGGKRSPRRRP